MSSNEKPAKGRKKSGSLPAFIGRGCRLKSCISVSGEEFKRSSLKIQYAHKTYPLKGMASFELYRDAQDPKEERATL